MHYENVIKTPQGNIVRLSPPKIHRKPLQKYREKSVCGLT